MNGMNGGPSGTSAGMGTIPRRGVLQAAAIAAGGVTLVACSGAGSGDNGNADGSKGQAGKGSGGGNDANGKAAKGSEPTPLRPPATLHESPTLAELVRAGKLPKLADRLPTTPYVIPHRWVRRGRYGGQISTVATASDDATIKEYFNGSTLVRWLNDGKDLVPGLAERWEHNPDTSEWTFVLRKGLRWSDGQPFSTDDVMFWWNDLVLNSEHPETPPDEMKSGKGTVATMKKVDDLTLTITYDAPTPLTAERIAMWVNGSIGNGPRWIVPAHFAKRFHPRYNTKVGKDWAASGGLFDSNVDYSKNPKCPTMNGWMLESVKEGREVRYVRNPYYWCVTREGDQLPYADSLLFRIFKETKSGKLQVFQGQVDYLMGQFYDTGVADIATLQDNASRAGIEYYLWDSGSGTSAVFFLNYDHKDPAYRKLFRDKRFRQAISHAYDRPTVHKAVYYQQGRPTTGTMSPKAKEYRTSEGRTLYHRWRDSYVAYDPAKANRLLDELGLKKGSTGFRALPDGSPLRITLDFPADTGQEYTEANSYLAKNLRAVGIDAVQNPVPPDNYGQLWETGQLTMRTAWEVSDGPDHLVFPPWIVPIEHDRWAPLEGQWYSMIGTPEAQQGLKKDPFQSQPPRMRAEPDSPVDRLWKLYDRSRVEPDELKRARLVFDMVRIHIEEGPFFIGSVESTPRVVVKKKDLQNVPDRTNLALSGYANTWAHPVPAVYDPETYFWSNPDNHEGA